MDDIFSLYENPLREIRLDRYTHITTAARLGLIGASHERIMQVLAEESIRGQDKEYQLAAERALIRYWRATMTHKVTRSPWSSHPHWIRLARVRAVYRSLHAWRAFWVAARSYPVIEIA
jgi:hypothetical protein